MVKTNLRRILTGVLILGAMVHALAETPVQKHGWLSTRGGDIINENGNIAQLRGMSFFWSTTAWPGYGWYNAGTVDALVDSWGCTVLRVAYDPGDQGSWSGVQTVIDRAIEKGIYVVIDYHSHNAHNQANNAISFFTEKATQYKNVPNVIFEPYNEPVTNDGSKDGSETVARDTWDAIKPYLTNVTQAIRNTGAKNLVVLGTPFYCQHVQVAANDPVTDNSGNEFENVAYSFHFYAASHGPEAHYEGSGMESEYLKKAIGRIPIFVTEWGTSHADGGEDPNNNVVDGTNTDWWFENFIDKYHLSWCNWSVSDFQTSSAFSGGSTNPSQSGQVVQRLLGGEDEFTPVWKTGNPGPAKDTTFNMPATHGAARYNGYWGSFLEAGNIPLFKRDRDDGRVEVTGNQALWASEVTQDAADGENWVIYNVNSSSSTSKLVIRHYAEDGSGDIEIYLDEQKVADVSIQQNAEWKTDISEVNVSPGEHKLKFRFVNTTGTYGIEWFELTNNVGTKRSSPQQAVAIGAQMSMQKNGFTVSLPLSHGYTSYSLIKANGRVVRKGNLNKNMHRVGFNDIAGGMWLLKLESPAGPQTIKAFVGSAQ